MKRLLTLNNVINAVLTAVIYYFAKALFFDERDVGGAVVFGVCIFVLAPLLQWFLLSRRTKK